MLQGSVWPLGFLIKCCSMLRNRMLADPSFLFKVGTEVCSGCLLFYFVLFCNFYNSDVGQPPGTAQLERPPENGASRLIALLERWALERRQGTAKECSARCPSQSQNRVLRLSGAKRNALLEH